MMYWAKGKTVVSIAAACMVLTLGVAAAMDRTVNVETPPKAIEVNGLKFEPVVMPSVWLLRDNTKQWASILPTCRVTNTTTSDLYFNRQHFEFELTDETGRVLKPILIPQIGMKQERSMYLSDFVLIKASESRLIEGLNLWRVELKNTVSREAPPCGTAPQSPGPSVRGPDCYSCELDKFGRYQLKMHYRNETDKTIVNDPKTGKPIEIIAWTGKVDMPAVAVEIRSGATGSEYYNNVIIGDNNKEIRGDSKSLINLVGTNGVLLIRTQERMKQWLELLKAKGIFLLGPYDGTRALGAVLEWKDHVDFSKEMVLFVYRSPDAGDKLSIDTLSKVAAGWQVSVRLKKNLADLKRAPTWEYAAVVLPMATAVTIQEIVETGALDSAGQPEIISKQWQINAQGGDVVDGLQGVLKLKEGPRRPGDDIELTFELRKADLKQKEAIWVWDNKLASGYRNDAYLVTKPDGTTVLLRREVDLTERRMEASREVSIGDKPWTLGDARGNPIVKSLKHLGLDTTAPGVYTIAGLYMQEAGPGSMEVSKDVKVKMWGGNIATPPITVTIAKPE